MPHKDPIYGAFYRARRDATVARRLQWKLTFEQWWKIWEDSGHWKERGCYKGQYVMARFGDKGPYKIGNVRIILATDNTKEAWTNDYVPTRCNNMRKKHEMSLEGSATISRRNRERPPREGKKGTKLSIETRWRMHAAHQKNAKFYSDCAKKRQRGVHGRFI